MDVTIHWAGGSRAGMNSNARFNDMSNSVITACSATISLGCTGRYDNPQVAERLNSEGFRPPNGVSSFNKDTVYAFLVATASSAKRSGGGDIVTGCGVMNGALRTWRGNWRCRATLWVAGSGGVGSRASSRRGEQHWIIWADGRELTQLRRLRPWKRGGYNLERPAELITPRGSRSSERNGANRGSRRSGRKAPNSKRRTQDSPLMRQYSPRGTYTGIDPLF